MTNNKQKRTAMELADLLVRETRYYCEENGIDTTLGFELAKSICRENDLVATYVNLGRDGYADWISDIIISHFEEEKEESVNMTNERRIGYVICPANMDVAGSQEISVNDSIKKALDYAFGMCMFVKYPDYAVHEVSYLVSDVSFTSDLINIVRVTENTKINFLFFGTEHQSQQDLDKMIDKKEESVEMKKECTLVMRKAYRVFYSRSVMAESEDEARYIAHEYSCDGENYGVRELPVTDEGLVWLMKLDAMLYETYPNYDEKQADYRRKYTARFGVNPSDKDWDDLMSVVELYGESELEERGIKA